MNSRERVFHAIDCEPVDRTPWVPYAGVQAANLLEGVDAEQFLKSADLIVEGFSKAYEKYTPDAFPESCLQSQFALHCHDYRQ